jgi:hypothetical protein
MSQEGDMKQLPKKFRGAAVVRGLGMKGDKLDALVERKALDCFDATRDTYLVVADRALEDPDSSETVRCFADEAEALRYARAMANGNVDHRVLRVTGQTLVVATRNDL